MDSAGNQEDTTLAHKQEDRGLRKRSGYNPKDVGEREHFTAEMASAREEDSVRSSHHALKGRRGLGAVYATLKRGGERSKEKLTGGPNDHATPAGMGNLVVRDAVGRSSQETGKNVMRDREWNR